MLNEIEWSGKWNYHYVVIYYWDNVTKSLKPTVFSRYMNATKDNFSYTWLDDNGYDISIPFHRIMRITLYNSGLNATEMTIWERTNRLNELMGSKYE